ncbi:universal stress protein [Desulfallas thermosapovorans]|uniref:Nucleotide-binding universal stress UspA family protein n=1 Tax=Desulfallas thermosapovorans DSM 6562 TaxID=1121431 RepID=A0A5S4ZMU1_9FIRM|nr:universal stress protein [Desulfallas thermosapovorans]TYO89429.1 nucleotide-binding universal stress UspA family protein [Desulfallas thermosapovorans DSM 6562]
MKILVAVDGSDSSLRAAEYAAKFKASHQDSEVTLFTVACYGEPQAMSEFSTVAYRGEIPGNSKSFATFEEFTNACIISGKDKVDKAKKIFEEKGLDVKTEVISGDPANAILEYMESNGFDKIIMGSRGLGGFKGLLLGSVSNKVVSLAKVPVTIIK